MPQNLRCLFVAFSLLGLGSLGLASPRRALALDRPMDLYIRGLLYYHDADYEEALSLFKEALRLSSENEEIRRSIGRCYFQLGLQAYKKEDLSQARWYFSEALRYLPDDFRVYHNLSLILLRLKDYKEAANVARRGLRLKEDFRELLLILAECYRNEGNRPKLLEVFARLHRYYPDDLEIALKLGLLYRINRKASEAMSLYKRLKEKYPQEKRIYERIAEIHSSGFRYDKAREEYEVLLKFYPEDTQIKEKIAELFRLQKRYREARELYEELLEASAKELPYYTKIAQIYEEEGDLSSAIATYKRAKKVFPKDMVIYGELARLYQLQAAYPESEDAYKKMIDLDPLQAYPWVRLGILYEETAKVDSATMCFRKATELGSLDPLPYYRLGRGCKEKEEAIGYIKLAIEKALKRMDEIKGTLLGRIQAFGGQIGLPELFQLERNAEELSQPREILKKSLEELLTLRGDDLKNIELDLKGFLEEHPKSGELLEQLGILYEEQARLGEAVAIWERLLKSEAKRVRAHLGLARAYEGLKSYKEAILAYKRVVELDPGCREAYLALVRLYKQKSQLSLLREEWEKKTRIRDNPVLLEYLTRLREVK